MFVCVVLAFLPTNYSSLLFTCPTHPSLAFLDLSVICATFSLCRVFAFLKLSIKPATGPPCFFEQLITSIVTPLLAFVAFSGN